MKRGEKRSSQSQKNKGSKSGAVRIISGRFRGRKLPVLDVQGLRPTTDKNKETLFNWLMPYLHEAKCLDAFAGSGSLGFEALSRYAQTCTFIELDKKVASHIIANIDLLKLSAEQAQVLQGTASQVIEKLNSPFDLIFLDPPFHKELLPEVIAKIAARDLLAKDGVIYIECEGQGRYTVPDNWQLIKEKQSAQVIVRLFKCVS